jgi:DNA replication protein DnaC
MANQPNIRDYFKNDYWEASLSKLILPEDITKIIFEWIKQPKDFLIFCGNPGVGKTYLCAAIVRDLLIAKLNFRYFSEINFLSHLRGQIEKDQDFQREIDRICETPFFILDDIGANRMNDWQREVVFSFVDSRSQSTDPTIITSNLFLEDMKTTFGPRFYSRMKAKKNTIIELNWIDKRQ